MQRFENAEQEVPKQQETIPASPVGIPPKNIVEKMDGKNKDSSPTLFNNPQIIRLQKYLYEKIGIKDTLSENGFTKQIGKGCCDACLEKCEPLLNLPDFSLEKFIQGIMEFIKNLDIEGAISNLLNHNISLKQILEMGPYMVGKFLIEMIPVGKIASVVGLAMWPVAFTRNTTKVAHYLLTGKEGIRDGVNQFYKVNDEKKRVLMSPGEIYVKIMDDKLISGDFSEMLTDIFKPTPDDLKGYIRIYYPGKYKASELDKVANLIMDDKNQMKLYRTSKLGDLDAFIKQLPLDDPDRPNLEMMLKTLKKVILEAEKSGDNYSRSRNGSDFLKYDPKEGPASGRSH